LCVVGRATGKGRLLATAGGPVRYEVLDGHD